MTTQLRLLNLYGVCGAIAVFMTLALLLVHFIGDGVHNVENGIIFLGGMVLIVPPFVVVLIKFVDNLLP